MLDRVDVMIEYVSLMNHYENCVIDSVDNNDWESVDEYMIHLDYLEKQVIAMAKEYANLQKEMVCLG